MRTFLLLAAVTVLAIGVYIIGQVVYRVESRDEEESRDEVLFV